MECLDDNTCLPLVDLSLNSLINFLKKRFSKDPPELYAWLGTQILISLNPLYKNIDFYLNDSLQLIADKTLGDTHSTDSPKPITTGARFLYPHQENHARHTIIVSGECGSGKTEVCNFLIRHYEKLCHDHDGDNSVSASPHYSNLLVKAGHILEFLGNSLTPDNKNSSRFSKLVELHITQNNICFANVETYSLTNIRVVCTRDDDNGFNQNFHSFYSILNYFEENEQDANFEYNNLIPLSQEISDALVNYNHSTVPNHVRFELVNNHLSEFKFPTDDKVLVCSVLLSIIHLLKCLKQKDLLVTLGVDKNHFVRAMKLLKLDPKESLIHLTTQKVCDVGLKLPENRIRENIASFCRLLYNQLFHFVKARINKALNCLSAHENHGDKESFRRIRLLDFYGFEACKVSFLEQFTINYFNEKLHHFFISTIVRKEHNFYKTEGIPSSLFRTGSGEISNDKIIELYEGSRSFIGAFKLLKDASTLYSGDSAEKFFIQNFSEAFESKKNLKPTKKFRVNHSFGCIEYDVTDFVKQHTCNVTKNFESWITQNFTWWGKSLKLGLSGCQLSNFLNALIKDIENDSVYFIKCMKPNNVQKALYFDADYMKKQLIYNSIDSIVKLYNVGFSCRLSFSYILQPFSRHTEKLKTIFRDSQSDAQLVKLILKLLKIPKEQYIIGSSMVFFTTKDFTKIATQLTFNDAQISQLISQYNTSRLKAVFFLYQVLRFASYIYETKNKRLTNNSQRMEIFLGRKKKLIQKKDHSNTLKINPSQIELTFTPFNQEESLQVLPSVKFNSTLGAFKFNRTVNPKPKKSMATISTNASKQETPENPRLKNTDFNNNNQVTSNFSNLENKQLVLKKLRKRLTALQGKISRLTAYQDQETVTRNSKFTPYTSHKQSSVKNTVKSKRPSNKLSISKQFINHYNSKTHTTKHVRAKPKLVPSEKFDIRNHSYTLAYNYRNSKYSTVLSLSTTPLLKLSTIQPYTILSKSGNLIKINITTKLYLIRL